MLSASEENVAIGNATRNATPIKGSIRYNFIREALGSSQSSELGGYFHYPIPCPHGKLEREDLQTSSNQVFNHRSHVAARMMTTTTMMSFSGCFGEKLLSCSVFPSPVDARGVLRDTHGSTSDDLSPARQDRRVRCSTDSLAELESLRWPNAGHPLKVIRSCSHVLEYSVVSALGLRRFRKRRARLQDIEMRS